MNVRRCLRSRCSGLSPLFAFACHPSRFQAVQFTTNPDTPGHTASSAMTETAMLLLRPDNRVSCVTYRGLRTETKQPGDAIVLANRGDIAPKARDLRAVRPSPSTRSARLSLTELESCVKRYTGKVILESLNTDQRRGHRWSPATRTSRSRDWNQTTAARRILQENRGIFRSAPAAMEGIWLAEVAIQATPLLGRRALIGW